VRRNVAAGTLKGSTLILLLACASSLAAQEDKSRVRVNRVAPVVKPVALVPSFSDPPTAMELTRARVFEEPLVPVDGVATDAAENRELAQLVTTYLEAGVPDATRGFEEFLVRHPVSPWRASLMTNLGVVWRRTGHVSKAYRAWGLAWEETKDATDRNGRAVADKALGEYVELNARLGRFDELKALFEQVKGRDIHGSATEKVSGARQAVWLMNNEPEHAFRCGPLGLDAVLAVGASNYTTPPKIAACPSTKQGTSLVLMRDLAKEVGASMTMAQRAPGAEVVVPALVHWNVGHFAALVAKQGDRYLMKDPTFGDELWLTQAALDEEASGYALVRRQALPEGWRSISDDEGARVWGKGIVAGTDSSDLGPAPPPPGPPPPCCPQCGSCGGPAGGGGGGGGGGGYGMPVMGIHQMLVSVSVTDTPLWYTPPKGPAVEFRVVYNQREAFQPQTFWYSNLGTKWTFDWLSYITDDPSNPAAAITVYQRGGGQESVTGYNGTTQSYSPTIRSQAVITRTATSPVRYERQLPDGSVEVFGQPDGAASFPRRVFLTAFRDPQGNAVTFAYDTNLRLVAVTDTLGQVTTLSYGNADPLKITQITDPFGRTAMLTYDGNGRLQSITDLLGLTSSFTYGTNDTITAMTTPYGTTTVTTGDVQGLKRWAEMTDPLGAKERVEYGAIVVFTAETPPTGMNAFDNPYDGHHASVYWDKRAMAIAPGDPAAATQLWWALVQSGQWVSASVPLRIKKPLENPVWYSYQGGGSGTEGTVRRVTGVGRVIDDGSSQVSTYTYNSRGRMTQAIDPLGRETDYSYDATGLDLLQVKQKRGGTFDILETRTYNSQHEPLTITDAAGQMTTYTYNAAGQVLTITNAKSETTTYAYDANGYVLSVTGALPGATTTYAYDGFGRISTVTDSEGYAVTTTYDAANRPVQVAYPDGTTEQTIYNRLDRQQQRDRLGRITTFTYDASRRLAATRDPLGRTVAQEWCVCGSLDAVVDGNGNRTHWDYDVEARRTRETRANGLFTQYAYETTTPRLHLVTDPKGQVTTYTYARDNALLQTVYTNAAIATPSVSFTYDTTYSRVATMVDGTGTTTYSYYPTTNGQFGAGRLSTVDGPLANDTIAYGYDELGRVTSRAINSVTETMTYDALGRATGQTNVLGSFGYTHVGNTSRLAGVTYPNGQTTSYNYFGHSNDDRLQTIDNKYSNATTLSKFDYTYDAVGNILTWQQQADSNTPTIVRYGYDSVSELVRVTQWTTDAMPVVLKRYAYTYDLVGNRTSEQIDDAVTGVTYDGMNRLVSQQAAGGLLLAGTLSEAAAVTVAGRPGSVAIDNTFSATVPVSAGTNTIPIVATDASGNSRTNQYQITNTGSTTTFAYDANGNLLSDGTRTFEWDAQDQLLAINQATHRTEFAYDGQHRRVRIVERDNGSIVIDQYFLWDGDEIVERRAGDGSDVTSRFYRYGWTENGVAHYRTHDHLTSTRDVTDSSSTLQARYAYDPFGRTTIVMGNVDDPFQYSGVLQHAASGLLLMKRRLYSPDSERWLSEDPLGMKEGPNLYVYVLNQPLRWVDPQGTFGIRPTEPNGNVWPGFSPQNYRPICDLPGFFNADGRSCVRQCCQTHDVCYEKARCNYSSWLTVTSDNACSRCNRAVALCVINALPLPPGACTSCEPTNIDYDKLFGK
jgi:RHS repeat-associated protein